MLPRWRHATRSVRPLSLADVPIDGPHIDVLVEKCPRHPRAPDDYDPRAPDDDDDDDDAYVDDDDVPGLAVKKPSSPSSGR